MALSPGHRLRLTLPLLMLSACLLPTGSQVDGLRTSRQAPVEASGPTAACSRCRCSENLETGLLVVNCSMTHLTSLDDVRFPGNTHVLVLDSNTISSLGADCFGSGLHNLSALSLKHNHISAIHQEAFRGLSSLRKLDLSANSIEHLPEKVFAVTPLLEILHLQFNNHLSAGSLNASLKYLQNLETLDLAATNFSLANRAADTWITMLPSNFQYLKNLKHLNLEAVGLRVLEDHFFQPIENTSLAWLNLAGNIFREIHNTTFARLSSLKFLDLSRTFIDYETTENVFNGLSNTSIDTIYLIHVYEFDDEDSVLRTHTFRSLESTAIRVLHLENNYGGLRGQISHRLFRHLYTLEELYLDACMIHTIEYNAFQRLDKLTILSLRYNFLNCLQGCGFLIGSPKLASLEVLDLTGNVITQLGESKGAFEGSSFPRLRWLSLRNNRLTSLNNEVFAHLKHLSHLDLSMNPLAVLSPGAFRPLPALRTLLISDCGQLVHLLNATFKGLAHLDTLQLERNGLKEIAPGAFTGLRKLRTLSLRDNKLAEVDVRLDSTNLTRLDLGMNNLQKVPIMLLSGNVSSTVTVLILDYNRIATASADDFGQVLPSVTTVDVSHNSISLLDVTLGSVLPALQQINLAGNPIQCDCHVNASFSWLHEEGVTVLDRDNYFCGGHAQDQNIFEYRAPSWQCSVEEIFLPLVCFFLGLMTAGIVVVAVIIWRRVRRTSKPCSKTQVVEEGSTSRRNSGSGSCTNNSCYPLLTRRKENGDVDTQRALLPEMEENHEPPEQQPEGETPA